jgi:hypothetical protein
LFQNFLMNKAFSKANFGKSTRSGLLLAAGPQTTPLTDGSVQVRVGT